MESELEEATKRVEGRILISLTVDLLKRLWNSRNAWHFNVERDKSYGSVVQKGIEE